MSTASVGFEQKSHRVRTPAAHPIEAYRLDAASEPVNRFLEIEGPGAGIRFLRAGSHSFESFAELAKTVAPPASPPMSDRERALAVYRFSTRHFHNFTMGWGGTEMTRFINGFGYSYCWGQADFQHLLYEACGVPSRAPSVKAHSTAEVLVDGKWRLIDAFMRVIVPSAKLDGLATGREMFESPDRWNAMRDGGLLQCCRDYWSQYGLGATTYEPWQDSRAMLLNLRRGEKLRIDGSSSGQPCMAAYEPDDYLNGRWAWNAQLDETHLKTEAERHDNVAATAAGLRPINASSPAEIEYRVASPYPLVTGSLALELAQAKNLTVSISIDGRKTWTDLQPAAPGAPGVPGADGKLTFVFDDKLSNRQIPTSIDVAWSPHKPCYDAIVRVRWSGDATLRRVGFDFVIQAHRPSVPNMKLGVNRWRLIGCETAGGITHAWDEYPGLRISNARPNEGETVRIEADVHNRGTQPSTNVRVRFTEEITGTPLGEVVVPRIEAGSKAVAALDWKAAIHIVERREQAGNLRPYVRTAVRVDIGDAKPATSGSTAASSENTGSLSAAAQGVIVVRPLPRPMFNDGLVWSSDTSELDRELVVLRAAVIHLQGTDKQPMLYIIDNELDVTLTPYLGHPDRGGLQLAPSKRLRGIQPSEFEVAEWELAPHALAEEFEVWIEAKCAQPVAPGSERLLAKRSVSLRTKA